MVQNMELDSLFPKYFEPLPDEQLEQLVVMFLKLFFNWQNRLLSKQRMYAALHHSPSIGVTVIVDEIMYNTCQMVVRESIQIIQFVVFPKASARSITRKPRRSLNPQKFSFSSQTKYSPPIITFVHGINPYLEIFFR